MVSLYKFIESVRKKPKHVRSQYAFWASLFLTLCVALIWGFSLKAKYAPEEIALEPLKQTESSFINEFSEIVGSMFNISHYFKGTFEYAKDSKNPTVTPKNLDLDALVASSTNAERMRKMHASTTVEQ